MPTVTVKPSGGDYTSLAAAEAGEQGVLSEVTRIECSGDLADSSATIIDGWTTSAANYIQIVTPQADRHAGKWDAAKYRHTGGIETFEDYVRVEGLQFRVASTNFSFRFSGGADSRLAWCVFDGCTPNANGYVVRGGATKAIVFGCVFNNCGGAVSTFNVSQTSGTTHIYNCTIRGSGAANDLGVRLAGGTFHCRNVAVLNTFDQCFIALAGTLNANYCVSDDATADDFGGTGNKASQSFGSTFVDAAGGDLHLLASDTVLRGAGQDLSSDPDSTGVGAAALSLDIDGVSRVAPWDIGADEATEPAAAPRADFSVLWRRRS